MSEENESERYSSKVTSGRKVVIPKRMADRYKIKEGDVVDWIIDEEGNISIELYTLVKRVKSY